MIAAGLAFLLAAAASPASAAVPLAGVYDSGNAFARILRAELPVSKVYEDDRVLAFMSIQQATPGHVLIIPKHPARNLLDANPADLAAMMRVAQLIAAAQIRALGCDGVRLLQNSGAGADQSVPHLHLHVIPMWTGKAVGGRDTPYSDRATLDAAAKRLRDALAAPR